MKSERLTTHDAVSERVHGRARCGVTIEMVPDGPALVRGAASVSDDTGARYAASRPVVAVCTCGLTQRGPWCDATHKVAQNS